MSLNVVYEADKTDTYRPTDASIAAWGADQLGITLQTELQKTKNLALSNPTLYLTDRDTAIGKANTAISNAFLTAYKRYMQAGIGDDNSKKYALQVAKSVQDHEWSIINLKFPDVYNSNVENKLCTKNILEGL